jgi:hypothetical protein
MPVSRGRSLLFRDTPLVTELVLFENTINLRFEIWGLHVESAVLNGVNISPMF